MPAAGHVTEWRFALQRSTAGIVVLIFAAAWLALVPATDAAPVGIPPILECRVLAQCPTEVLLRCHIDGPAITAAANAGRVLPPLGYIAVPLGARASLAVVPDGPASTAGDAVRLSTPLRVRGIDVVSLGVDLDRVGNRDSGAQAEDVEIRVSFAGGTGQFGEPRLHSRWWEPLIERWILNHASLPPLGATPLPSREDGCEYIIICPDEAPFTAWADSLRSWRTLQGVTTEVFTTTEIGTTWQDIRDFLVNAYSAWTVPPAAFLLLGDYPGSGDDRQIGIPAPIYNGFAASDNLYADIDGDGLPDMFHGRITARTATEVANMVGKLLAHERTPSLDPSFYAQPVLAGGWEPDGRTIMELETLYGFQANSLAKEPAREYVAVNPGTVWPDPQWVATFGPGGYGYLPPTPEYLDDWGGSAARINDDINAGAFMVIHRGAATETSWGDPLFTIGDVAGLHNTRYPLVLSLDCLTGKFNSSGTCLTEALHRSPHGAVGMISATEVGYSVPTTRLMLYLIDAFWPGFLSSGTQDEGELRPASALVAAKYVLATDVTISPQQKLLTYHLFHHHGDPFLVMNTEVPQPLSVEHAAHCTVGASSFTVQADEGALIGLTIDGVLVGVGQGTGAPSPIPITPPVQEGTLRVTVTQQNHLRYDQCVPILDAGDVPEPWPALEDGVQLSLVGASPHMATAQFRYAIPAALAGTRVTLRVHDITGRSVRTLVDAPHAAGAHESCWDGADDRGAPMGTGIYFARLTCDAQTVTRRIARLE